MPKHGVSRHQGKGMQRAETEGHPTTKRGQQSRKRTHKLRALPKLAQNTERLADYRVF